jgi:phosphoribosylformylglycinamidine synthase subunit PurL
VDTWGADEAAAFFGEDQGRYLVTVSRENFGTLHGDHALAVSQIGTTGGSSLKLGNARAISVEELKAAHEGWFPAYMGQ